MAYIIAIDGPAGAGKSTTARQVARLLGFTYLDTGAMYRAVAWKARKAGLNLAEVEKLVELSKRLRLEFSPLDAHLHQRVWADGEEITQAIRTLEVSRLTSALSALPEVRAEVVGLQRALAAEAAQGVVLEGRDIGTVVFPEADLKIFLTASPEVRATRRFQELQSRGEPVTLEQVLEEQKARDANDSQRQAAPLRQAPDAIRLETDGLSIEQVVAQIVALFHQKVSQN